MAIKLTEMDRKIGREIVKLGRYAYGIMIIRATGLEEDNVVSSVDPDNPEPFFMRIVDLYNESKSVEQASEILMKEFNFRHVGRTN